MGCKSDICGVSLCSKFVEDGIQCDRCGRWYHELCSQLSKQCYILQKKHTELNWVCMHCLALAEECSRILMGAVTGVRTAAEPKAKVGQETRPSSSRLAPENANKVLEAKGKKSTKQKTPQSGSSLEPQEANSLQARVDLLEKQIRELQQSTQIMLGRTKNILLHNLAEPLIRNAKARREADRRHVMDVFRLAGMSPMTPFTKFHRVGTWKGEHISQPRPILVVFSSTHTRDLLLSKAYMVHMNTRGCVKVTPDEGLQKNIPVPAVVRQGTGDRGILGFS